MGHRAHLIESTPMKALRALALLGFLAVAACQSAGTDETIDGLTTDDLVLGGDGAEDTGKVVGVKELPPRFQAILDAWKAGGFVWEVKRSEVLSDPEETRFLVDNLVLAMFDEARSMQRAQSEFIPAKQFERSLARIKSELAACGPVAAQAMAEILAVGDDFASAMARDVLSNLSADAAPAVAALLDRDKAVVRYRALEALSKLPNARAGEPAVLARLAEVAQDDRAEVVAPRLARRWANAACSLSRGAHWPKWTLRLGHARSKARSPTTVKSCAKRLSARSPTWESARLCPR